MSRIIVIPDPHAPFTHVDALEFLDEVNNEYSPDGAVCLGDLFDIHKVSRHDSDPDGYGAGEEFIRSVNYFKDLAVIFPDLIITQGNHDTRFAKAAYKAGIPSVALKRLDELLNIPGWEFVEEVIIDEVLYLHGTAFGGATPHVKAMMTRMRSVVMGHFHTKFGVEYFANKEKLLFGCCGGCLMDSNSYAAAYGKELPNKPILGCQVIDDGRIVHSIPMVLGADHRWVGQL